MMFNDAQINKLKKMSTKMVETKFKKQEEEDNKKKQSILNTIFFLEKKHPNRGKCLCLWNGITFHNMNNKLSALMDIKHPMAADFELIETTNPNEKYYMLSEESYNTTKKIYDFMTKHYAELKMSVVQSQKADDPGKRLRSTYMLGAISEEFTKEFPGRSMIDFINLYKQYDSMIMATINKGF